MSHICCCRPVPIAEDHGTPIRHHSAQEWPGDSQLQSRGQAGADYRVVEGRPATGHGHEESPRYPAGRIVVLPARSARQEGAGRRGVLVCGQECSGLRCKPQRHASCSRSVSDSISINDSNSTKIRVLLAFKYARSRPRFTKSEPPTQYR